MKSHLDSRLAITFDPNYISKSGKFTPYLGCFLFGCAGKAKHELEIFGIDVMDFDLHTCLHLEAVQPPSLSTLETVNWTSVDWYLNVLRARKGFLLDIRSFVVATFISSK